MIKRVLIISCLFALLLSTNLLAEPKEPSKEGLFTFEEEPIKISEEKQETSKQKEEQVEDEYKNYKKHTVNGFSYYNIKL